MIRGDCREREGDNGELKRKWGRERLKNCLAQRYRKRKCKLIKI
jgi:hypothetical protein